MKKILILVLMAILLTGCGKKSPPVPPKQMMSSQNMLIGVFYQKT